MGTWTLGFGLIFAASVDNLHAGDAGPRIRTERLPPALDLAESFRSEAGDRVFFAENSAGLGSRARVALEAQARWLVRHSRVRLLIEGHSDDPGDAGANLRLAERRAEVVRDRLVSLGVQAERVTIVGLGQARPAAVCMEAACAAHNRRVVTRIAERAMAEDEGVRPDTVGRSPGVRPSLRRLF